MIPIPSNPTKWLKNRTLPLLAALLACIGLYPIFMLKPGMSENLFQAVVICIPLFGLFALTHWKRAIPLVGLFLVMIIWSWLSFGFDQTRVARSPISYLACLYYIYAIVVLASELLKNESLIDDRVYGGTSQWCAHLTGRWRCCGLRLVEAAGSRPHVCQPR